MKRLIFLFAVPYFVTVTDLGKQCVNYTDVPCVQDGHSLCPVQTCFEYADLHQYHLSGFQDCVSSSAVQCSYLQDLADDLNLAHEKGYEIQITSNSIIVPKYMQSQNTGFDPDLQPAQATNPICHKLVGGIMHSVPCEEAK